MVWTVVTCLSDRTSGVGLLGTIDLVISLALLLCGMTVMWVVV